MTASCLRFVLLASLCLSIGQPSIAADDPSAQTFVTPSYPAAPIRPGTGSGAGTGLGTLPDGSGSAQRGTQLPRSGDMASPPSPSSPYGTEIIRRIEFPPAKPSEFQKFVETATGRLLPVFGADFFTDVTRQPGVADNVPVSADYTVGPGDQLLIRVWGSIDVDYRSTVDRNGQINLPKIGSFSLAGVKASELEKQLRAQIGRLYTNFNLSVSLGQLHSLRVFVVGPAQKPGVYTLPSQSTLLSAMAAAGGPAAQGSLRHVTLRRDGAVVSELDFYEFLVQGDKSRDLQLANGDVVVFQAAGPRVALNGATDAPAIYELKSREEPLRELLRYSGGAPVLANPYRAQLERIDPNQPKAARFVEEFGLDATGLDKVLRDGDVLTLLAISPQFANAVTLKGHVAQPLRYPYKPGMRIRDLIPDRDALISPDFYRRKNLLVQVIEEDDSDTRFAQPPQQQGGNRRFAAQQNASTQGGSSDVPLPGQVQAQNTPSSQYGTLPEASVVAAPPVAGDSRPRSRAAERADDRDAVNRARRAPAALFEELNWDYAVIERLNERDLSTQVIPFNLGKAVLQGDEANNVELLPGDVVTVFSQKDVRVPVSRQTRLVSIEGEVGAPGVYQLLPGETLRGLIARAGGFTPQAYVYGLEFSREETRRRQRENLNDAIARLESLSATQSARVAANRRDDAGAASSIAVSNAATQAQLARLQRLQPNGRIALELSPEVKKLDELPDVPLEHADRISVPSRPGFVTVAGAVANSNAFLWKPGRTAGDYLRLAGVDEAADPSNMFVLRADGTVASATDKRGLFGRSGIDSQEMQPGDALIVPSQLDYETFGRAFVRNLKDWTQIFSQFGLGAAAIKTLRQ
jgi:polysaccharide biosynthesis/export protein